MCGSYDSLRPHTTVSSGRTISSLESGQVRWEAAAATTKPTPKHTKCTEVSNGRALPGIKYLKVQFLHPLF